MFGTGTGGAKDQSITLLHRGRSIPIVSDDNSMLITSTYSSLKSREIKIFDDNNTLKQTLYSPNPSQGDDFGQSTFIKDNFLVIGAPGADNGRGAVYLYQKMDDSWNFVVEISNPNSALQNRSHQFGHQVMISDVYLIVSSPFDGNGKVYFFDLDFKNSIPLRYTLQPPIHQRNESRDPELLVEYGFGIDMDLRGDELLIGSDNNAAFYFSTESLTKDFSLMDYEIPYDHTHEYAYDHLFARAVSIGENYLFISSLGCDEGSGKVRFYNKDDLNTYIEVYPEDKINNQYFGYQVSENNSKVIISSFNGSDFYSLEKNTAGEINFTSINKISLKDDQTFGRSFILKEDTLLTENYYNDSIVEFSTQDWSTKREFSLSSTSTESRSAAECQGGVAAGYPCNNVDLLAFMNKASIGGSNRTTTNDIWGWTDSSSGKEYAIVGMSNGTSFVDVSDPENPVYIGILPTATTSSTWRDIKTYNDYAFIVSEAGGHGLQILDLTKLRNFNGSPITFSTDAYYTQFGNAHNIFINESTGYAYAVGTNTCGGGLHVVDIRNPLNPFQAGCFADPNTGRSGTGYVHDTQCVIYQGPDQDYQGKEICFGSNETAVWIVDVSNKITDTVGASTIALGNYSYGYTHQGWLTEDQRYFIQNDELDEYYDYTNNTRTLIWNVENLDNPFIQSSYYGPTPAIDHNNYTVGNKLFMSHYTSGVRILDIGDINGPYELGYFDLYPASNNSSFDGTWSNYPYFESGTIVATGIDEGLYIIKYNPSIQNLPPTDFQLNSLQVVKNPQTAYDITTNSLLVDFSNYADSLRISWTESTDPEGETIDYKLYADGDLSFLNEVTYDFTTRRMYDIQEIVALTDSTNRYVGQLKVFASDGINVTTSNAINFYLDPSGIIPKVANISQNYPNPFDQSTTIKFDLPDDGYVSIRIFNAKGQLVRQLVNSDMSKGYKSVVWDGKNESGQEVSSGIYFYQIDSPVNDYSPRFVKAKKMLKL